MTLNEQTLDEATKARDEFIDLQHKTEVARVDYHHLIRQLHVKGGSLREIAEALGLSHQRVHQIVEPVDGSTGPRHHPGAGGPGMGPPHMHRLHRRFRGFLPFERFADEARTAVAGAIDQAEQLGHRRVGTEHLLLGVAGAPSDTVAARALTGLGISADAVRGVVVARLGSAPSQPAGPGRRPFTPAARRSLARALKAAHDQGDQDLHAHHVLLGVVRDGGDGAAILAELGADSAAVEAAVAQAAK